MALAKTQGIKPGSSIGSQKIRIPDAVVTSTGASTKDFELTQPAGTIIESIYVHAVDEIALSGGGATSDVTVTIGTNSDYSGTELVNTTLIDYSAATTASAGKVVKGTAAAAFSGSVASDEVKLYGQVKLGAAATVAETAGVVEIHIIYRHF